jgi:hypothetical protein
LNAETAQKILRPVKYEEGFHFFMPDGHYTGETALSLCAFLKDITRVDKESLSFHFSRGDLQKWIQDTLGDNELAAEIDKLERSPSLELKEALSEIVQKRISQLQHISP